MTDMEPVIDSALVTRTSVKGQMSLDNLADAVAGVRECQNMIAYWKQREDDLKAQIAEAMGDNTSGTVAGREVVVFETKNQFNGTAFKREYPDLARLYVHTVSKEEVDVDLLRHAQPAIYARFQTRAMRFPKVPGDPRSK